MKLPKSRVTPLASENPNTVYNVNLVGYYSTNESGLSDEQLALTFTPINSANAPTNLIQGFRVKLANELDIQYTSGSDVRPTTIDAQPPANTTIAQFAGADIVITIDSNIIASKIDSLIIDSTVFKAMEAGSLPGLYQYVSLKAPINITSETKRADAKIEYQLPTEATGTPLDFDIPEGLFTDIFGNKSTAVPMTYTLAGVSVTKIERTDKDKAIASDTTYTRDTMYFKVTLSRAIETLATTAFTASTGYHVHSITAGTTGQDSHYVKVLVDSVTENGVKKPRSVSNPEEVKLTPKQGGALTFAVDDITNESYWFKNVFTMALVPSSAQNPTQFWHSSENGIYNPQKT